MMAITRYVCEDCRESHLYPSNIYNCKRCGEEMCIFCDVGDKKVCSYCLGNESEDKE